ncbi:MAG: NTP transferase domain-containing protein [Actinomycetota bacterium]|nr:NTP transferase domain-containing protein [Actinomycetota bacterium]
MAQIVVPFRGASAKQRLDAPDAVRSQLALAMLGDVLTAAVVVGRTLLVSSDRAARELANDLGAEVIDDPGGGQGAAVAAALDQVIEGPVTVLNADLPCVVPHDLRTLAGASELGALGYVEAEDGTTNALALPDSSVFAPLYGAASAARFRDHARSMGVTAISCAIPNLGDDVDTLADLKRVGLRAGPRTQAAIGVLNP